MQRGPLVRDIVHALATVAGVEVKRQQMTAVRHALFAGEWLRKDRFATSVFQLQDAAILEARDPSVGAEIAVERAVLVDEDDHVFDVRQPSARGRRLGERAFQHLGWRRERLEAGDRASGRPDAQQIPPC